MLKFSCRINALITVVNQSTRLVVRVDIHGISPFPSFHNLIITHSFSPVTGLVPPNSSGIKGANLMTSRPVLERIVKREVDETIRTLNSKLGGRGGGVLLGICGSDGMVKDARRAVRTVPGGEANRV